MRRLIKHQSTVVQFCGAGGGSLSGFARVRSNLLYKRTKWNGVWGKTRRQKCKKNATQNLLEKVVAFTCYCIFH